jgi:hypothetical protein
MGLSRCPSILNTIFNARQPRLEEAQSPTPCLDIYIPKILLLVSIVKLFSTVTIEIRKSLSCTCVLCTGTHWSYLSI